MGKQASADFAHVAMLTFNPPANFRGLLLAFGHQLTAPEIALATGTKLNTVYSRLRAARVLFDRAVRRFAPRRTHGPVR